ncbi:MAG: putative DNA binding domain-containing protein [Chloroflexi bacterium]|nr:putative DNA binding domain-containing protein [Chloroflexota bacterium]
MSELEWVLHQDEGQFFDRKSCYDRSAGKVKRRPVRDVARDVAETLVAMANADGGTVALGLEDDTVVSGVDYPEDRMEVLRRAPRTHALPPLNARIRPGELNGQQVLLFEVDWSSEVHQLTDGRYLLRIGDQNMPFPASDIEGMKEGRRRRATEARFVAEASLADLDLSLVQELGARARLAGTPDEILMRYRVAERRSGKLVLSLAALLLFGKDPYVWHPRCGIDFVKYEGTEQRVGAALNIVKRERLGGQLVQLIDVAYRAVQPHVRERQQLVDLFFEERLEYPTSAWQEAIVNAVAHRDYRYEGLEIEVWMFDDRLEVRSPGELVEPVTIERLRRRERVHASRNPRIVRVLTDFGFMREQGEGIPRMFEAMERQGLYPPDLRLDADVIFTVSLRNTPVYSMDTLRWLGQFERLGLNGNQKRLLAYAREHDHTFTSRAYQSLVHVDLYTASRDIKGLICKGTVQLSRRGGRVYELLSAAAQSTVEKPADYVALEPVLASKGYVKNEDIREVLGVSRRQAARVAERLVALGWLRPEGRQRGWRYVRNR